MRIKSNGKITFIFEEKSLPKKCIFDNNFVSL
nr:MAG TPA: hypothetical protein [Caudoviricetes sp.]